MKFITMNPTVVVSFLTIYNNNIYKKRSQELFSYI